METSEDGRATIKARIVSNGIEKIITGEGNGPVSAFVDALTTVGAKVRVLDYSEHALTAGGDAKAAAYVECEIENGDTEVHWGVGIDPDITTASLKAVMSAVNRHTADSLAIAG